MCATTSTPTRRPRSSHLPAGARAGILVAARVYREIGVVLRRRDGDCWSSRARVGAAAKTIVTLRALRALRGSAGLRPGEALGLTHGVPPRGLPLYPGAAWSEEAGLGD